MIKIQEFANGSAVYRIEDGVEIGVKKDSCVYWATPEGWDWVISPDNAQIAERSYKVKGHSLWITYWDGDFYLNPPA